MGVLQHWQHLPGPAEPLKSQSNKDSTQSVHDQHWRTCTAKASPGLEKQPGEQLRWRPGWAGGARPDTGTAVPRRTSPAAPAEPTKLPAGTATKTTQRCVHILPHSLPPTAPVPQGPGWARDSPDWHKTRLGTNAGKTNRNSSAAAPSIWLHGRRASAGVTPQMPPPPVPPAIPTPLERRERQAEGEEAVSSRQGILGKQGAFPFRGARVSTPRDAQLLLRQHQPIPLGFLLLPAAQAITANSTGNAKPQGTVRTAAEFLCPSSSASTSLTVWARSGHLCRA